MSQRDHTRPREGKRRAEKRDSSAISTGVAVLLSAVTTPVRASVQTGEPPNLAREGDPIGLTAEAGGFARPNHGLTTVVTGHGLRYPVEISENSPVFACGAGRVAGAPLRVSQTISEGCSGFHLTRSRGVTTRSPT